MVIYSLDKAYSEQRLAIANICIGIYDFAWLIGICAVKLFYPKKDNFG